MIIELSIILDKYFLFSVLHVADNNLHIYYVSYAYIDIHRYSTNDLNYILFHEMYIYMRMIYVLLMFFIHLFL